MSRYKSPHLSSSLFLLSALLCLSPALAQICDGCKIGTNVSCDLDGVTAAENNKYFISMEMYTQNKPATVCEFSNAVCTPSSTFNFYSLYFCDLQGHMGKVGANILFVIIGGILIFIFMYNLASTADEYLSPALEHIVVRFSISESLAGVTFLAFGNGAPDVFSSIATARSAAKQDSNDNDSSVGNNITAVSPLLGSMVFLTTVVITLVNFVSKPDKKTKVTPKFFLRDYIFLLAVVLYELILLVFVGRVTIWSTLGFLIIYAIFVVTVIKTNNSEKGKNELIDHEAEKAEQLLIQTSQYKKKQTVMHANDNAVANSLNPYRKMLSRRDLDKITIDTEEGDDKQKSQHLLMPSGGVNASLDESAQQLDEDEPQDQLQPPEEKDFGATRGDLQTQKSVFIKKNNDDMKITDQHIDDINLRKSQMVAESGEANPEKEAHLKEIDTMALGQRLRVLFKRTRERNICTNIISIIDYPLTIFRNYTVPMAEEDKWDKFRAAVVPISMVISFLYLFGFLQGDGSEPYIITAWLSLIPGSTFAIYVWFCTKKTVAPPNILTMYAFLAFLMSVAWINWTSNCVVDLIVIFGFITGLPQALLSLTVLAWGNSLGDMSADTAMTRKGFGEMAITATMAGPIFNILMGQGLSSFFSIIGTKWSITEAYIPYSIKTVVDGKEQFNKVSVLPLTLLISELIILMVLLFNALKNEFNIDFKISRWNAVFYLSFTTFLIVYSIVAGVSTSS